jgi:putative membrane protein
MINYPDALRREKTTFVQIFLMNNFFKSIIRFGLMVFSISITAYILPGVQVDNWWTAIVLAAVLGVLNTFLKPLLIFFTIPVTFFTFGLFLFVINGLIIAFAEEIVPGFSVNSFFKAMIFSLVLSIINSILEGIFGVKESRYSNQTEDNI